MKTPWILLPLVTSSCCLTVIAPAADLHIRSDEDWKTNMAAQTHLDFRDGMAIPTDGTATFQSSITTFPEKRRATSLMVRQPPTWENWIPTDHLGPSNLGDAPVFLRVGPENYWIFGRYNNCARKGQDGKPTSFEAVDAELEGFDIPLKTTPYPNQFDAPGGLKKCLGGYHAWQSRDMIQWVHHGPVSDAQTRWMSSAEHVDGKTYFYYDFPNDQDPHLIIDEDLTDGKIGKKMGMAFKDPSHGSDSAIIRDLDGKFHLILENWDPIKASTRSWDSPLASHAVSENGIDGFKLLDPAVDYRTNPTGNFGTYRHPHWNREDPDNYPTNEAQYEIHNPEQEAFGDWAAIAIGGQYYLFGDYDPAGAHGKQAMSVGWFTSPSINEPFKWCGHVGKGHPDPDIMFAEGQFYLVTQNSDFVSPGPWVEKVEVRVGVDTSNDGSIDQWTGWYAIQEHYEAISGFAKQVGRSPAELDLGSLPEGYGFQFEIRLTDTTENASMPIIDEVKLRFAP